MSGQRREVDHLLRQVVGPEYGCTVKRTKSGHWRVSRPGHTKVVTVSHSPSDAHALRNIRSDLRRFLDIDL